ncbi:MAG: ribosome maturation factor RimM [Gemmatimonadaceae bacterium]
MPWSRPANPANEGDAQPRVRVAHVRRAHGLRGEMLVRALTARPDAVFALGRELFSSEHDAAAVELLGARTTKDGWLLALAGVPDRTAAEQWRGRYLWAAHDEITALGGDTPFAADLVGLRMELTDGSVVGTVSDFYDLPQGPVLEVTRAEDKVLFPLRAEFVSRVDRERRVLVVDPPAGLFD